ncbi:MaoC/PaaZ C-terminal domain-containing protein [Dactylosporangium sp. CA-139066]|uniref:MaoC/PaaZ C-terminal domain-containing protein n=1 Tax=Dactylosporangium sp. CA-139066 TaxID=3239930 RepID=UPI003D938FAB
MALDLSAVGARSAPVEHAWTSDDALLYALAVGAGQDPLAELDLTTEHTEGVPQRVLPTFGALLSQKVQRPDIGDFDRSKLVHAEQHLTLAAPLPTAGAVRLVAEVEAIHDKGGGALVWTATHAEDLDTGARVFSTRSAAFIRGEGGFGGERGGAEPWQRPDRSPDEVVRYRTRPEQALLYRLTGDRNPLHSDPAFAARGGFDRPILHGMCTFGFTGRALVRAAGGDPDLLASVGGRFTAPVVPGEELEIRMWVDGDEVLFQTLRGDGTVVIDRGRAVVDSARAERREVSP